MEHFPAKPSIFFANASLQSLTAQPEKALRVNRSFMVASCKSARVLSSVGVGMRHHSRTCVGIPCIWCPSTLTNRHWSYCVKTRTGRECSESLLAKTHCPNPKGTTSVHYSKWWCKQSTTHPKHSAKNLHLPFNLSSTESRVLMASPSFASQCHLGRRWWQDFCGITLLHTRCRRGEAIAIWSQQITNAERKEVGRVGADHVERS